MVIGTVSNRNTHGTKSCALQQPELLASKVAQEWRSICCRLSGFPNRRSDGRKLPQPGTPFILLVLEAHAPHARRAEQCCLLLQAAESEVARFVECPCLDFQLTGIPHAPWHPLPAHVVDRAA